ncbi:hypothetical protein [Iningainema tapete]|uniref:Uncharacterized protein n=1 Tax=Iningainema tapete BLCC-T55 TaxID=2748662 RepID=A0A8J7C0T7_9CYAN|nr:hypothetical protein [Iningainema tapete]MBD2778668.1 hypothetical protein [Iningainema tapete BLCC-T55]
MTRKLGALATETLEVEDPKVGRVKVMLGCGFHFLQSPNRAMEIIRVEVIQPVGRNRKFQPLCVRNCKHKSSKLQTRHF